MRSILAIAGREMRSYFVSPLAYVIIACSLFLTARFFTLLVAFYSQAALEAGRNPMWAAQINVHDVVIRQLYQNLHIIFLLMMPIISMRLLAEEKKQGTAELLLTAPVTTVELVGGKFAGALGFLTVLMLLTIQYPLFLWASGAAPPVGAYLSVFLGTYLLAAAFLSIGLLMSSLTENQIIAAVTSFVAVLLLWLVGYVNPGTNESLTTFLKSISLIENTEDFLKGIIDTRRLVFFLTFILFNLFLTQRVIDSRRWR